MTERNLTMPGNPRYQPKDLKGTFGYDNLAVTLIEVELAAMDTLADMGVIPAADIALITPAIEAKLFEITTTQMDEVERAVTKHDIRALVRLMQEVMPEPLRRWVHVPLTSYDVIDTARMVQFRQAHVRVVQPKIRRVIEMLRDQAIRYADLVQIGRTHGQHALPITVGFWFAGILHRVLHSAETADWHSEQLFGKVSGAVGAYNAQQALGLSMREGHTFERKLLQRLGLVPATISSQILQPEPLAQYLFACVLLSAALGQFGRDGRHLMRTEIAELGEPFEKGQVGSSTMAHKRNPINFENLESTWLKNRNEIGKVLDTLISEHQRDLVGSAVSRDFPVIVINLVQQLDTLLREGKDGVPFLARITVDTEACRRNLAVQGDRILAEPFYLALQMYGYPGDAHEVINHQAMPMIGDKAKSLYEAIEILASNDADLGGAWSAIPVETKELFRHPDQYTGRSYEKVLEVCKKADEYLRDAD